jgi:RNA polymerase sigma-70 factor (ECF subfamily)
MSGASETLLLQRLLQDDPAAWREIVSKYSGLLLSLARRTFGSYGFTASNHDCEDVVSEVWSNLLRNDKQVIRRCLERGQLLPMLHVLTRNRTIDVMRRRKFVTEQLDEELTEVPSAESESELPLDPNNQLPKALGQLSAKERTLVDLFYLQGKKYREIELLTGVSQNSVGPTLARALAKLREWIAKNSPA